MVDPANLNSFLDKSVPVDTRLEAWLRMMFATSKILMTDLPLMMQDFSRTDDLLWLEGLMLRRPVSPPSCRSRHPVTADRVNSPAGAIGR